MASCQCALHVNFDLFAELGVVSKLANDVFEPDFPSFLFTCFHWVVTHSFCSPLKLMKSVISTNKTWNDPHSHFNVLAALQPIFLPFSCATVRYCLPLQTEQFCLLIYCFSFIVLCGVGLLLCLVESEKDV